MSATMVDSFPHAPAPHRKPLPTSSNVGVMRPGGERPSSQDLPLRNHRHSRTVSSSIFPLGPPSTSPQLSAQPFPDTSGGGPPPNPLSRASRTCSNATLSTTSTSSAPPAKSDLRRFGSASSRGSVAPTSYVALMRKQKATVWCDRSQAEDPALLAQQRAARQRAAREMAGPAHLARNRVGTPTSAGSGTITIASGGPGAGLRSKIRHHAPRPVPYAGGNLAGQTGVPMRLSASEVDEDGAERGADADAGDPSHRRSGSGRSSIGSGRRVPSAYLAAPGAVSRYSVVSDRMSAATPPSRAGSGEFASDEPPSVPGRAPGRVASSSSQPGHARMETGLSRGSGSRGSESSGSVQQKEGQFGGLGEMRETTTAAAARRTGSPEDELRRRGSVDDRTTSMGANVRLFVANPDLDD